MQHTLIKRKIDIICIFFSRYHRRFIEVSQSEYLGFNQKKTQLVVEYFTEKWKNIKKPFKHNSYYAKKKGISINSSAFRFINNQPLVFISENNEKRYNKRKITELPSLISKLEPENVVINAAEHFIFDFEFLYCKILNSNTDLVIKNIKKITQHIISVEDNKCRSIGYQIQLFTFIYLMDMFQMQKHPDSLGIQLTGRVLIFYKCFDYFKKLIDESDKFSSKNCSLLSAHQYLHPPGSGLFTTFVRIKIKFHLYIKFYLNF